MNLLLLLAVQTFAAGSRSLPPRLAPSAMAPRFASMPGSLHLAPISNEGPSDQIVDERPYWEDFPGARVTGGAPAAATGPAEGPKWVEKPVLQAAFIAAPDIASLDELDGKWLATEYGADHEGGSNGFGYVLRGGEFARFQARANGDAWLEKERHLGELERGAAVFRERARTRTIYLMGLGESIDEELPPYTIAFRKDSSGDLLVELTSGQDVRYFRLKLIPD